MRGAVADDEPEGRARVGVRRDDRAHDHVDARGGLAREHEVVGGPGERRQLGERGSDEHLRGQGQRAGCAGEVVGRRDRRARLEQGAGGGEAVDPRGDPAHGLVVPPRRVEHHGDARRGEVGELGVGGGTWVEHEEGAGAGSGGCRRAAGPARAAGDHDHVSRVVGAAEGLGQGGEGRDGRVRVGRRSAAVDAEGEGGHAATSVRGASTPVAVGTAPPDRMIAALCSAMSVARSRSASCASIGTAPARPVITSCTCSHSPT